MASKVDQDRQRAIRDLLTYVRDFKNASKKTHKHFILDKFIRSEPIFGSNGDRLLHVLIQYENPTNGAGCEFSLWSDAPDTQTITAVDADPKGWVGGEDVQHGSGRDIPRHLSTDRPREPSRGIGQKDARYDPSATFKSGKKIDVGRTGVPETPAPSQLVAEQKSDNRGLGRLLLKWLLKYQPYKTYFTKKPDAPTGQNEMLDTLPLYLAIGKKNLAFLACFIGVYCDPKSKDVRPLMDTIIETKDRLADGNCIHAAIEKCIPFTSCLVAVCSDAALLDKDIEKHTPLHRAIVRDNPRSPWIPLAPAIFKQLPKAPLWEKSFEPDSIFTAIQGRPNSEKLLQTILTSVNTAGYSPLQDRRSLKKVTPDLANRIKEAIFTSVKPIADVSTALYGTTGATKELYLNMADFNQASHNFHGFVEKLTQSSGRRTMAPSANPLPDIAFSDPYPSAMSPQRPAVPPENPSVNFEEILFFVHLPDLNYVKQPCPHSAISKLFLWLKECGVHTIRRLRIPDSTQSPLSEAFVQKYVFDLFRIESLDWRKLDINTDVLLRCAAGDGRTVRGTKSLDAIQTKNSLQDLTLYSSGSWSTLYHWSSEDGLIQIPQLKKTRIHIVHLNQTEANSQDYYDAATHKRHAELSSLYASRVKKRFATMANEPRYAYVKDWEVKVESHWDYPLSPHEPEEPSSQTVKHQFTSQLLPSVNALQQLEVDQSALSISALMDDDYSVPDESGEDTDDSDDNFGQDRWAEPRDRFRPFALAPEMAKKEDQRIRVAIIDNGADRIRSRFRHQIAKGQSFVSVDDLHSDQPLPWWMVSDAHGTQMASLVSQTNPYCQLYIARVGTRRNDIRAENAVKAINWAIEHDVDIISMSWTLDYNDAGLSAVIKKAADRRILLFASTPDEGIYSEAWPADDPQTISVSATDEYGHLTSKARATKTADVQIPGENIRAAGPAYIGNALALVSGSSVATALAAGLASLALLLLQTFNNDLPVVPPGVESDAKQKRHMYYTKAGMLDVFQRMAANADQAILLRRMFPVDDESKDEVLEKLSHLWNVREWNKRRGETRF